MRLIALLQNDALEQVSRGFREYSRSQGGLAFVLGVILAFAIAASLLYALVSNRDRMVGLRMFKRLARASHLSARESDLLSLVARRVLPDNPPAIFVRRTLFESVVSELAPDAELVQSLRRKVYGP